jgi:hypothetical protein
LDGLQQRFSVAPSLPATSDSKKNSIREIRNAFEHIEDCALGQVKGKPYPEALPVFEQGNFVGRGILRYGSHSLDLRTEVPRMLVEARQYVYDVAVDVVRSSRKIALPVEFLVRKRLRRTMDLHQLATARRSGARGPMPISLHHSST